MRIREVLRKMLLPAILGAVALTLWLAVFVGAAVLIYSWRMFANGKGELVINGN